MIWFRYVVTRNKPEAGKGRTVSNPSILARFREDYLIFAKAMLAETTRKYVGAGQPRIQQKNSLVSH